MKAYNEIKAAVQREILKEKNQLEHVNQNFLRSILRKAYKNEILEGCYTYWLIYDDPHPSINISKEEALKRLEKYKGTLDPFKAGFSSVFQLVQDDDEGVLIKFSYFYGNHQGYLKISQNIAKVS